jgi:hypothetical protein
MREALEQWIPKSEADVTGSLIGSPTSGLLIPKKGSSPRMRRLAGIAIAILAIAWPAYLLTSIERAVSGVRGANSPSADPAPSPTVPVDPSFQAALAQLEAAVAASGRSRDLDAPVAKIRSAAQIGDRLGVSEQLLVMRNKVQALLQEGEMRRAEAEPLLAGVFGVELQLGKVVPPVPLNPSPSPLNKP